MQLVKLELLSAAQNADRATYIDVYSESGAKQCERMCMEDLARVASMLGLALVDKAVVEEGEVQL
jgi:hypothetical protein